MYNHQRAEYRCPFCAEQNDPDSRRRNPQSDRPHPIITAVSLIS